MLKKIQFLQTLSKCSGDTKPGLVEKKQTGTPTTYPDDRADADRQPGSRMLSFHPYTTS